MTIKLNKNIFKIAIFGILAISFLSYTYYLYNEVKTAHKNAEKISKIALLSSEVLSSLQNFLIYETIDTNFYITKRSQFLDKQDELILEIGQNLSSVDENNNIDLTNIIDSLKNNIIYYNNSSRILAFKNIERGFKDYGLIGKMRKNIHFIEKNIDDDLMKEMLIIRRHEKDYLLRKDLKYQVMLKDRVNMLKKLIRQRKYSNTSELVFALENYEIIFDEIVYLDDEIGYTNNRSGLINKIKQSNSKIHVVVNDLSKQNLKQLTLEINRIETIFQYLTLTIILLTIFFVVFFALRSPSTPIELRKVKFN